MNNDATTNSQFNNSIAVDQTTHFIAITWLDARNAGPANDAAQVYATVSTKRGRRWIPNVEIATGLSNANAASSFEFGDYDTMDYHAGRFYRSWADNASPSTLAPANTDAPGDQDLAVARVDVIFSATAPDDGGINFDEGRLGPMYADFGWMPVFSVGVKHATVLVTAANTRPNSLACPDGATVFTNVASRPSRIFIKKRDWTGQESSASCRWGILLAMVGT